MDLSIYFERQRKRKKGSSFSEITDADLEIITNDLNNRPRKSLGFSTPNEVFNLRI